MSELALQESIFILVIAFFVPCSRVSVFWLQNWTKMIENYFWNEKKKIGWINEFHIENRAEVTYDFVVMNPSKSVRRVEL